MERKLFIAQRLTAMLLAVLVIIHLGLILYAVRGGLTADEILARTQDNLFWAIFYGLFVIIAAIHAPLGIRKVLQEWTEFENSSINIFCWLFSLLILVLGFRAVVAVI